MKNSAEPERPPMPSAMRNWLPCAAAAVFAGAVLLLYAAWQDEISALPFTWPVAKLAGFYLGAPFAFDRDLGFVSAALSITIGKNCAGVNFFVLFFCMSVYVLFKHTTVWKRQVLLAVCALAASYAVTVLVNSARIIASVALRPLPVGQMPGMHTALGVTFYFTALFIGYVTLRKLINKGGPA